MTGELSQKGTQNYMAPEVMKGNQYDATVDIYSLGLDFYRLLNKNRLPFLNTEKQMLTHSERMAAIKRRMDGEEIPAPCEASSRVASVILYALAYNPKKRFASATAMKNALNYALNNGEKAANNAPSPSASRPEQQPGTADKPEHEKQAIYNVKKVHKKKRVRIAPILIGVMCFLGVLLVVAYKLLTTATTLKVSDSNPSGYVMETTEPTEESLTAAEPMEQGAEETTQTGEQAAVSPVSAAWNPFYGIWCIGTKETRREPEAKRRK